MVFTTTLEVLQRYNLRGKPSKLSLVPIDNSSVPNTPIKKYLIPGNIRLLLNISKQGEDKELSGDITIIRIKHGSFEIEPKLWPSIYVGGTKYHGYLRFCDEGAYVFGQQLNKIQLSINPWNGDIADFSSLHSIHINGNLNGEEIDSTIYYSFIQGKEYDVNPACRYCKTDFKTPNLSVKMLYLLCSCDNCIQSRLKITLSERQKFLIKLSRGAKTNYHQ
jgi:hypothetical protein